MHIRITKQNERLLSTIWVSSSSELNQYLKKVLSGTKVSSSPVQDDKLDDVIRLCQFIYDNTIEWNENLEYIVNSIKQKVNKSKQSMSAIRWNKWTLYKEHELKWWVLLDWWWVEFTDLLTQQPYKAIKANIDSWEYLLD